MYDYGGTIMPHENKYNAKFSGSVSYSKNVIVSIVSLATMEICGVACLRGKKVVTDITGDKVAVDVYIDVKIGFSCADIAFKVQENIKRSIESMTNLKTGTINVNILGVSFDDANMN